MRRTILSAAAPACLLIGLTPVAASAASAPGGAATATAAQAGSLVGISNTGARADNTQAQAQAAVITVGGQPVLGTGGSQSSDGENGGALADTGSGAPIHAQVAPWHTKAHGMTNSAHRTSSASAAAASADVPSVVKADVLKSDSQADHESARSTASSTSEALDLGLGDSAHLVLLHSEVSSAGKGHSYLVGLNGTEIGTGDQLGKICAVAAPDLVALSCLTASGGVANGVTSGAAQVAGATTLVGLTNPAALFSAAANFGPTPMPQPILPAVAPAVLPIDTTRAVAPAAAPGELPRTGSAPLSLGLSGLTALLGGLFLRRKTR